jgi:hypothetical protein
MCGGWASSTLQIGHLPSGALPVVPVALAALHPWHSLHHDGGLKHVQIVRKEHQQRQKDFNTTRNRLPPSGALPPWPPCEASMLTFCLQNKTVNNLPTYLSTRVRYCRSPLVTPYPFLREQRTPPPILRASHSVIPVPWRIWARP